MTIYRPHIAFEGPDTSCVIDGHVLGWSNCTPASFCMAIERSTAGRVRLTACSVRDKTGDVSGGTTLDQNAYVSQQLYGIKTDVHNGNNVADPVWLSKQVQAGRPVVIQGNAGALLSSGHRSTKGMVNHATFWNESRGGTFGHPEQDLIYDPAADGRRAGWGTAVRGPQWWPHALTLKFLAALIPASGSGGTSHDAPVLGPGKAYAAVFPDSAGAIWGSGISASIRGLDPDGRIVADAVREAGQDYGTLVDYVDLVKAFEKRHRSYGHVIDASDVQWLLNWAISNH